MNLSFCLGPTGSPRRSKLCNQMQWRTSPSERLQCNPRHKKWRKKSKNTCKESAETACLCPCMSFQLRDVLIIDLSLQLLGPFTKLPTMHRGTKGCHMYALQLAFMLDHAAQFCPDRSYCGNRKRAFLNGAAVQWIDLRCIAAVLLWCRRCWLACD